MGGGKLLYRTLCLGCREMAGVAGMAAGHSHMVGGVGGCARY